MMSNEREGCESELIKEATYIDIRQKEKPGTLSDNEVYWSHMLTVYDSGFIPGISSL